MDALEAVAMNALLLQHGNPDLELCDLPVEVPGGQALPQEFDAVHPIVGKTIPRIVF